MRTNWTRERIIRGLLERQVKGEPLTVGGRGVDVRLYNAARRIFGSWRNAVQAAGIAPERVFTWERWTPAKILVMVRQLAQRGRPLTVAQMERRYGNLVSAARRHYGSWNKAMLAAGVDPSRLQRVVPWNQGRVIESILMRALRNESLTSRCVEPRSLVEAAQRFFGSWLAAVAAAGLDPTIAILPSKQRTRTLAAKASSPRTTSLRQGRRFWTKEMVVEGIQHRARNGQSLSARAMAREDNKLYGAGRRHLRSWSNALREAGFDPAEHRLAPRKRPPAKLSGANGIPALQSRPHGPMRPDLLA